jgi:hypothetical protein
LRDPTATPQLSHFITSFLFFFFTRAFVHVTAPSNFQHFSPS